MTFLNRNRKIQKDIVLVMSAQASFASVGDILIEREREGGRDGEQRQRETDRWSTETET